MAHEHGKQIMAGMAENHPLMAMGKQMMASMPESHKTMTMGKGLVKSTVATATVHTGAKLMNTFSKHPALVFGLGVLTGYLVYKYRKQIISSAAKAVDAGKDFVLEQKESLEDIVAETKETSES